MTVQHISSYVIDPNMLQKPQPERSLNSLVKELLMYVDGDHYLEDNFNRNHHSNKKSFDRGRRPDPAVHEAHCRRVCDYCRGTLSRTTSTLCTLECDWYGPHYNACFTMWGIQRQAGK